VTSDPIGLEGGQNTYSYVSNNPINVVDPLGLKRGAVWEFACSKVDSFYSGGKDKALLDLYVQLSKNTKLVSDWYDIRVANCLEKTCEDEKQQCLKEAKEQKDMQIAFEHKVYKEAVDRVFNGAWDSPFKYIPCFNFDILLEKPKNI